MSEFGVTTGYCNGIFFALYRDRMENQYHCQCHGTREIRWFLDIEKEQAGDFKTKKLAEIYLDKETKKIKQMKGKT